MPTEIWAETPKRVRNNPGRFEPSRVSGPAYSSDQTAPFTQVKTFSATKSRDRRSLGERVTHWLRGHEGLVVVGHLVRQSSDSAYHCITIILFLRSAE
jgi:hypothetical protein